MLSVLAMTAILVGGFNTHSIAQSLMGGGNIICNGDSVCLEAPNARGTVTWFASTNSGPYGVIGTGANFCTIPPLGNHLVYGVIEEGSCDPIYTDTLAATVVDGPGLTVVTDSLLMTDCGGTIADIPADLGLAVTGSGPFSFTWTTIPGISNTASSNPSINSPNVIGSFPANVSVVDGNGCVSSLNYTLIVDPQGVSTFNFTGASQSFTIPACVDTIFVQAWGGQGGSGAVGGLGILGGSGGLGGYAEGFLVVTPGDVINVFVGGQGATPTGGYNGGAIGGAQNSGGGGGASDIRVGGTSEADRVLVAGGGGGGGRGGCETANAGVGGAGGVGGGGVGGNGGDSPTSGGVAGGGQGGNFGAVQGAFGAKGIGCSGFSGTDGTAASTGSGGVGGTGQSCCCFTNGSVPGGGGGGGGFLGGGGGGGGSAGTAGCSGNDKGAGGGGGGGSNYTGGVLNGSEQPGIWLGNGMITISW